ncbi:PEP synthetase regulatory protein [Candidatus Magnetoovum chiemensis]|nr:PEP synthetase regulatory protein [Candidatus Magnetoovum chiemensis]
MDNIVIISDGTGTTAQRVVEAVLTQFKGYDVTITKYSSIDTPAQIQTILKEAANKKSLIVYSLVSANNRALVYDMGRKLNIETFDILGPLLNQLTQTLPTAPLEKPGLYKPFNDAYMRRIDAIEFTVNHDDGQNPQEINQADIVLLGVSRSSKTPLSIYLANEGWRVANIPLIYGIEPPQEIFTLPKGRVFLLTLRPERLSSLRLTRTVQLGTTAGNYAELDHIRQELNYAKNLLHQRPDWHIIDMTTKSIEEAAGDIIKLIENTKFA